MEKRQSARLKGREGEKKEQKPEKPRRRQKASDALPVQRIPHRIPAAQKDSGLKSEAKAAASSTAAAVSIDQAAADTAATDPRSAGKSEAAPQRLIWVPSHSSTAEGDAAFAAVAVQCDTSHEPQLQKKVVKLELRLDAGKRDEKDAGESAKREATEELAESLEVRVRDCELCDAY